MSVQLDFWELVKLLLGFFGFLFAAGKLLLTQIDRRLDSRFSEMETARQQAGQHWDERFAALSAAQTAARAELARRVEAAEGLRERVARIETGSQQALDHEDIDKVYDRVNELAEQVGHMAGELNATRRAVEMLQSFLLNQKGGV